MARARLVYLDGEYFELNGSPDRNGGIQRSWTSCFSSERERTNFWGKGADSDSLRELFVGSGGTGVCER